MARVMPDRPHLDLDLDKERFGPPRPRPYRTRARSWPYVAGAVFAAAFAVLLAAWFLGGSGAQ